MIASRDLIAVTRQLGSMTEAGVDILRAIRVLRAQTRDAELLALYDRLAHDMRLGSGLADAMSRAPEAFSPFAISIVRQGEARGDLAGSFYRIADYLQKEQEVNAAPPAVSSAVPAQITPVSECPVWLRRVAWRIAVALGCLLGVVLLIELAVALEMLPPRWHLTALTIAGIFFCLIAAWRLHPKPVNVPEPHQSEDKSTFEEDTESTFTQSNEATFE